MEVDCAQVSEARLILRWASKKLNPTERASISDWLDDMPLESTAARLGITRSGVFMAKKTGMKKMRRNIERLGIVSATQVFGS